MAQAISIRRKLIAYGPFAALLTGLLALEFLFPGILTRKYLDSVYISDDADRTFFIMFVLGAFGGFNGSDRFRLSFFWLWLVLGSFVAAAVANTMSADVLARFYLTSAIEIEFAGAVFGYAVRPDALAGLWVHIFNPAVCHGSRLRLRGRLVLAETGRSISHLTNSKLFPFTPFTSGNKRAMRRSPFRRTAP